MIDNKSPMIRRTFDAAFLNSVANDPAVRPGIGGAGEIDLAAVIASPLNVALQAQHGGWLFLQNGPHTVELHTLFLPQGRGRDCLAAWKQAARYMFARTDAHEIVTRVPANNKGADFAARHCGFRERFVRKDALAVTPDESVDMSYRALTIDDWWPTDAEAARMGRIFHAEIDQAKIRFSSALPDHPHDEAHDMAAGAAALMMAAGNTRKAAWFYNRWATLAGYPPIRILSETPVLVDLGAGVIASVHAGYMEVLRCP